MYIGTQTITYIIGGLMIGFMLIPLIIKQYYVSKTKGKMLIRSVQMNGEEKTDLVKLEGSVTESNKQKRSYIPKSAIEVAQAGKVEGNIATTYYPEGLPRPFQVKIQTMTAPEANPMGINFYSKEKILMTAQEVGTVHGEAYSKAVMETSNDARDIMKELKGFGKGINKSVVYIMMGISIVGILAVGYLVFQNSQTISNIASGWGW